MTGNREREYLGSVETELAVAVELVDVYTDATPIGPAHVSLVGMDEPFRRGPSGYYIVRDLPEVPDPVEVAVNAPGYVSTTASEEQDDLDDLYPVITVELTPGPSYEFGAGETLVRGHVTDGAGAPISDATVRIDGREDYVPCDENGEFVLWLDDLAPDDVATDEDGRRFVDIAGADPTIVAERTDGSIETEPVELEIGTTASVTIAF